MSEFAAVLNVADIDGSNGFRLDGDAAGDYSGRAVAGGGDVDGDGFADLLISAQYSDTGGANRGLAWVVFGAASAPAAEGLAALVAAGTAYRFLGEAVDDRAGFAIANAGDVNGDGFDDLIIGAPFADPDVVSGDRGASYLVFGGAANLEALDIADSNDDNRIALANLTLATGYRFDGGTNNDNSGWSVSGAGDVNGDGFDDLLIGAPNADPNGGLNEGASYIVFGGDNLADLDAADGIADGRIDLANVGAGQGLRLDGATVFLNDQSGQSLALVGDVNGDGFDDVLVGALFADPNGSDTSEGAAYLVFGREDSLFTAASLDLATLTGLLGTRFDGAAVGDQAGRAVNGLGDVNGDGFADIVIGAFSADPSGLSSGSAYVVFGRSGFGASTDLAALTGSNGFRLDGLRAADYAGISVSAAGDVNGDGFDDILVGANGFDRIGAVDAGAAFVVFGKASGFAAVIDLGALSGDDGFRIEGAAILDNLGRGALGAAGDVNGDGFDDIVVGGFGADNNSLYGSGSTYVIYGHRAETAVTRVGTNIDNAINGGKGDDTISGLSGNDTLIGWEGDDTILGGDGDDALDGGEGNDDLSGGSGRDVFLVSDGEDHLAGGSDKDQFNFAGLGSTAIIIDLSSGEFAHPNGEDIQIFVSIEDVVGTAGADTISGTSGKNVLNGAGASDTIAGGDGNDVITGGATGDALNGGLGSDRFDYNAVTELKGNNATTRDTIAGFTVDPAATSAFIDRLDLSTIDAQAGTGGDQAFSFIAQAAFSAEGQIRAIQSGADTIVQVNTTGTTGSEMTILLQNFTATDLAAVDFIL